MRGRGERLAGCRCTLPEPRRYRSSAMAGVQLAAVSFLGFSLVVAGVRSTSGCELMAIPDVLFGKHIELACLIFSPLDRLERKLRSKRDV